MFIKGSEIEFDIVVVDDMNLIDTSKEFEVRELKKTKLWLGLEL